MTRGSTSDWPGALSAAAKELVQEQDRLVIYGLTRHLSRNYYFEAFLRGIAEEHEKAYRRELRKLDLHKAPLVPRLALL